MRELLRMADQIMRERPNVVVGVTGKRGSAPHHGGQGETVVDIAAVHEFGSPAARIPERSFIRHTIDQKQDAYRTQILNAFRSTVLYAATKGAWRPETSVALKRFGLRVEGDIKKRIAEGIPPPLSPVTIAKKGSTKALIDTGQLRASIASELRKGRAP